MKKKGVIIFSVVVIVILIVGVMYISLVSSKTVKAQLNVEEGAVFVNGEEVRGTVILNEEDLIKTSGNGRATIILYETLVVSLEPDTEITITDLRKKHPQLTQTSGETWNTLTKVIGIEEYTIQSGNSVASIRGTTFLFTVDKLVVYEGEIDYEIDSQSFKVVKDNVVERVDGVVSERVLNAEERAKLLVIKTRARDQLQWLREREIEKQPRTVNIIKNRFDLTDEDIRKFFQDADEGIVDLEELKNKAPVNVGLIEKVTKITVEIRELNQEIRDLSG